MRKVFLSSTSKDLFEYREAVAKAIHGLDDYHCVRMEDFGARDQPALEFCRSKVRECDLFVGILGLLYGSRPEGGDLSYTEDEYVTAIQAAIPRLMFVSPENFNVPGTLRESDEMWRLQQAFRGRVNKDQIRATFSDPDELARAVVSAIYNWEKTHRSSDSEAGSTSSPDRRPRPSQERGPNLGSLVTRMCDRKAQEEDFADFFREQLKGRRGAPQIFLIHGEESECPWSLVDRLSRTRLQDYAHHRWGEQHGVVTEKIVEWIYEGALDERQERLIARLFTQFDRNYEYRSGDFSASAFARFSSSMIDPMVVIRHDIRAARLDKPAKSFLERYLRFWDEVGSNSPKPQFIIFLTIIHSAQESGWKNWLGLSGSDKKQVVRELEEITAARRKESKSMAPTLLLKELACVSRDDVMDWFSLNRIYDDVKLWQSKCLAMFKNSDCLSMAEIEHELKLIHREFIEQRGYV
ncbi:MAG: DUF4062 domain-containing protein [Blastocatellales bacterium]